jgi:hypothetical protein
MNSNGKIVEVLLLALIGLILNTSSAWAHKNNTKATMSFSDNPAIDGTLVTITGTVVYDGTQDNGSSAGHSNYPSSGTPITAGLIQIDQLRLNGNPVACGTASAAFINIAQGSPNGSGNFSTLFSTMGLGGQTIGFRAHHPATAGSHGDSETKSDCFDLQIILALDPLPDGTRSYTQGFYGASPVGEGVVENLIDETTCVRINYILEKAEVVGTPFECDNSLPLFLTGTVGPGRDNGFLPSGFLPGQNLAAQMITLLLNLNLANVLPAGAIPMNGSHYLNINVVEDLFGDPPLPSVPPTYVDPVLNISELGSCTDLNSDNACDDGTVTLTNLGSKVAALDAAASGTTVQNILDAAVSLLTSGSASVTVNGVSLTKGDLTQIVGLINESFDEGIVNGFVTAYDAD